jgi:hypothetical protein
MTLSELLPFLLLALSLVAVPLMLFVAVRALRRADARNRRSTFASPPSRNGTHRPDDSR